MVCIFIFNILEELDNFFFINVISYLSNKGDNKEEGDNEVGEQPRRYRQPRQQNWYNNSYRGNRRGPPPNRGEGADYNNVRLCLQLQ